jgi:hypothetical protein
MDCFNEYPELPDVLRVYYWPDGSWCTESEFKEIPSDMLVGGFKKYDFDLWANSTDIHEKIDHLISVQGWF